MVCPRVLLRLKELPVTENSHAPSVFVREGLGTHHKHVESTRLCCRLGDTLSFPASTHMPQRTELSLPQTCQVMLAVTMGADEADSQASIHKAINFSAIEAATKEDRNIIGICACVYIYIYIYCCQQGADDSKARDLQCMDRDQLVPTALGGRSTSSPVFI